MEIQTNSSRIDPTLAQKRIAALWDENLTKDDFPAAYDKWAEYYDEDMVSLGFRGYDECGRKVKELLPDKEARILDFGCGTGIFGTMLKSMGYSNVYGIDASGVSIGKSRGKNAYRGLEQINVIQKTKMPYNDGFFELIISIGVLEAVGEDDPSMEELYRLLRPGGLLVLLIRKSLLVEGPEESNIDVTFRRLDAVGFWRRLPDERASYFDDDGLPWEDSGVFVIMEKAH